VSDEDWFDWPNIGGAGSLHDLRDADRSEPRLWHCKSVSRAAAIALDRQPRVKRRHIGFHRPRKEPGQ